MATTSLTHTLPAAAYTTSEMLRIEQDRIFAHSWILAGHINDLPEPDTYLTMEIAGEPVVVLRDHHGELRALSNVCRHRAMVLLQGSGKVNKSLQCPYHGWTYQQNGQLSAVSDAKNMVGLDTKSVCLPTYRLEVLAGLIFVTLDATIEAAEDWFGDLGQRLREFPISELQPAGYFERIHHQNWKVLADNFLEGYHIPVGHPALARLLDFKNYVTLPSKHYSWVTVPLREKISARPDERLYQRLLRPMAGFPPMYARHWLYASLWPCTFLDIYPDQIDFWQLIPIHETQTLARSMVYRPKDASIRARIVRKINVMLNDRVTDEDDFLCRGVQKGLASRSYDRGVLHNAEVGLQHFHSMLREAIPELSHREKLSKVVAD